MAPEQSERNAEITPSTDVWAFGLMAFKMLTGHSFWLSASGEGVAAILREVVIDPIPTASDRARQLGVSEAFPKGFDGWFARCVCRDAAARFENADVASMALFEALGTPSRVLIGHVRISLSEVDSQNRTTDTELGVAHTVGTPAPRTLAPEAETSPPSDEPNEAATVPFDGASPKRLVPSIVLVAAAAVVGLFFLARGKGDPKTPLPVDGGLDAGATGLPFCPREMARVQGGELMMGSVEDGPPHPVHVSPFCIDLTEVSVSDYFACAKKKACPEPLVEASWPGITRDEQKAWSAFCTYGRAARNDHPMSCVTFDEAAAYCRSAGKRLPNEEEWEYSARGKAGLAYPWGAFPPTPTHVNGCDEGCAQVARQASADVIGPRLRGDDGAEATAAVGSYLQGVSPFGVFDLSGNVAEWVDAPFCPYGRTSCGTVARVVRGGSWATDRPNALTSTSRGKANPIARMPDLGFRCVK
jgi:formylglycine-generating enzyme required for sulfatase activity